MPITFAAPIHEQPTPEVNKNVVPETVLPPTYLKKQNPQIVNRECIKIEKSYDFFTKGPKVVS